VISITCPKCNLPAFLEEEASEFTCVYCGATIGKSGTKPPPESALTIKPVFQAPLEIKPAKPKGPRQATSTPPPSDPGTPSTPVDSRKVLLGVVGGAGALLVLVVVILASRGSRPDAPPAGADATPAPAPAVPSQPPAEPTNPGLPAEKDAVVAAGKASEPPPVTAEPPKPPLPKAEQALLLAEKLEGDDNPTAKARAAREIAELGAEARGVVPHLLRALRDPSEEVRRDAEQALDKLGPMTRAELPGLTKALRERDPRVRIGAAVVIAKMGREGRETLNELSSLLGDPREEVRRQAVRSIAAILPSDWRSFPALLEALRGDDVETTRLAGQAIEKLGIAEGDELAALVKALTDPRWHVRLTAARLVAKRDKQPRAILLLLEGLRHPDSATRMLARPLLEEVGAPAVVRHGPEPEATLRHLLEALQKPEKEVRLTSLAILEQLGPAAHPATPAVLRLFGDVEEQVQTGAIRAIGRVGGKSPEAVGALVKLLDSQSEVVQLKVIAALGSMGGGAKPAVRRLLEFLGGTDPLREAAIDALAKIGPDALELLLGIVVNTKNPAVSRIGAAEAIARMGRRGRAATIALSKYRNDPDRAVRAAVIRAMEEIQTKASGTGP
jgi:HEAT repeat protein